LRTAPGGGSATPAATAGAGADGVPPDVDVRAGGVAVAAVDPVDAPGVVLEHPASTLKPATPVHSAHVTPRGRRSMQCTIDFLCQFF
jgi:hypothetical protein